MNILDEKIESILIQYPQIPTFFSNYGLSLTQAETSLGQYLNTLSTDEYENIGIDKEKLIENLDDFLRQAHETISQPEAEVLSVTIIGGHDKSGEAEHKELTLKSGTVTSIVGPTGSGKSRLLADIEWMAQNDTPTGRTILINEQKPDINLRFSLEHKLVAQLSQNMNFVMDTSVADFIAMHAESRYIDHPEKITKEIIYQANLLAGEPFDSQTPVTALSGGQSRALMIADTAFLSRSPIVLIDEIENAGIDRKKALGLLVKKEKIVLIATHDPILALMAAQRLVIKNGGIYKVLTTTPAEKNNLKALESLDNQLLSLRNLLRNGERLEEAL
ncbi:MAG: ATP-binding cassette domain-containing protein [Bacteroidaceae bacterium]|nr:ATP-binding cassette domain-containing protein [Bacteroidaceae bacterium]